MKRSTFLMLGAGALLPAQTPSPLGLFDTATDVGNPETKGSSTYDETKKEYRLSGAGENMWAKADQFQFLWKKLTGNFRIAATMHFVGAGVIAHRKAGIMLRKSLDSGSPCVDAVVHGDGLTGIQVRENAGDITRGFNFPINGATRFALQRRGNVYSMWIGNYDGTFSQLGFTQATLPAEVHAGLFICSHNVKATETAIFTDVTIEALPSLPSPAKKKA